MMSLFLRIIAFILFISGTAVVIADDTDRTPEQVAIARQHRRGTPGYGVPRKPGTFLLNMLIKNEASHLDRTLPHWAKIIDFWIIGVDDKNTDDSLEVIQKHLGGIPGAVVIVPFDGMGPTWAILVQHGIDHFPDATHGIVADADFKPMVSHLDRMELDIRCSKHMYTIWTQDHRNERKMDWIYQNIQGATVKRRTHQTVYVPGIPYQEVFQTMINLPIEEQPGGYQDRTPGKNERYIGFLEADLIDYPDDTRTLYYLGYAHYDIFKKSWDHKSGKVSDDDWNELQLSVDYMLRRVSIPKGNKEERWFTMLKLGEVYERYYRDWGKAEQYYIMCTKDDAARADAWFYLGQHYRLTNEFAIGYKYLMVGAGLATPDRALFQWHYLYRCLSKLELGRILKQAPLKQFTLSEYKRARALMRKAQCRDGDVGDDAELKAIMADVDNRIDQLSDGDSGGGSRMAKSRIMKPLKRLFKVINENFDDIRECLEEEETIDNENMWREYIKHIAQLQAYYDEWKRTKKVTCRGFRVATTPYLQFFSRYSDLISSALEDDELFTKMERFNTKLLLSCR